MTRPAWKCRVKDTVDQFLQSLDSGQDTAEEVQHMTTYISTPCAYCQHLVLFIEIQNLDESKTKMDQDGF